MPDKKIIAVVGATGAQGGGLVRAILADPNGGFAARAVVRDVNSDKALALRALGAEVVAGDVNDEASLADAFKGAYGAYCVTFYWSHFSPQQENAQAANLAKAAKAAAVKHVVWSTLEDTRKFIPLEDTSMPTLLGNYKVPHFDAKAEVDHVFTDLGVPTTFLYASFYWDNFISFGAGPKKGPDGTLGLTIPIGKAKMAGVAAEDIGKVAYGIFKKGPELIGKKIGVAGEHLTGPEMASAMTKSLGQPVHFNEVTPDVYRSFGFPGADDLGNMFQFYRDFEGPLNDMRDVGRSRALGGEIQTFNEWLSQNGSKIPLE